MKIRSPSPRVGAAAGYLLCIALGILGPRDHYRYIGSRRKMLWGIPETEAVRPPQTIPRKPN